MPLECCSFVPFVLGLFTFGYVSMMYVTLNWIELSSNWGLFNFFLEHFLMGSVYYHYITTCIKDPGSPSKEIEPPKDASPRNVIESARNDPKWCGVCKVFKVARSHHCSHCDRCVLRMDHHCVWVNNCVGFYNHKHFYLFLVYLTFECIHQFMVYLLYIIHLFGRLGSFKSKEHVDERGAITLQVLLMVLLFIIIVPTFLGVVSLCVYQTTLIGRNMTSIEELWSETERRKAEVSGKLYRNAFDRGIVQNLKEVLGNNVLCWLFPTRIEGDGLHFRTKPPQLEA